MAAAPRSDMMGICPGCAPAGILRASPASREEQQCRHILSTAIIQVSIDSEDELFMYHFRARCGNGHLTGATNARQSTIDDDALLRSERILAGLPARALPALRANCRLFVLRAAPKCSTTTSTNARVFAATIAISAVQT